MEQLTLGRRASLRALIGTNPVLDAIEDGHYGRAGTKKGEPERVCRVCGTAEPCARLIDARRAAAVRAGR